MYHLTKKYIHTILKIGIIIAVSPGIFVSAIASELHAWDPDMYYFHDEHLNNDPMLPEENFHVYNNFMAAEVAETEEQQQQNHSEPAVINDNRTQLSISIKPACGMGPPPSTLNYFFVTLTYVWGPELSKAYMVREDSSSNNPYVDIFGLTPGLYRVNVRTTWYMGIPGFEGQSYVFIKNNGDVRNIVVPVACTDNNYLASCLALIPFHESLTEECMIQNIHDSQKEIDEWRSVFFP